MDALKQGLGSVSGGRVLDLATGEGAFIWEPGLIAVGTK
jgi:hypothetical protein